MEKLRKTSTKVGAYSVQCNTCNKWRLIQDKSEYETIRENFYASPWTCNKKLNASCQDPDDIEYDESQIWAIDRPCLPKAPEGTERLLTLRSDRSKVDVQYVMPNGKRVRSKLEVERFLEANPEYKDSLFVAKFSFTSPRFYEDFPFKKANTGDTKSEDVNNTTEASSADEAAPVDEADSSDEAASPDEMELA